MTALYPAVLGSAWPSLAPVVQRLHGGGAGATGSFRVRRGAGALARFCATLLGMPREGDGVPVALAIARGAREERWARSFAGHPVRTTQWRRGDLLVEAFGPFQCLFRLRAERGALVFEQVGARVGWRNLVVPLPRFLAPAIEGRADPDGDHVRVHVGISAPGLGLLVAYDGRVRPDVDEAREATA